MGTVVVGYVPKPEGEAALHKAVEEAKLRGAKLVVVNSHRGGSDFDADASSQAESEMNAVRKTLDGSGIEYDVRQLVRGFEPAEDLISIAEANSAELIVIGLRRRSPPPAGSPPIRAPARPASRGGSPRAAAGRRLRRS